MILTYENRNTEIALERKKSIHVPPHLHEAIEMVYVTEGNVELGVGQELYHSSLSGVWKWKKQRCLFVCRTHIFYVLYGGIAKLLS